MWKFDAEMQPPVMSIGKSQQNKNKYEKPYVFKNGGREEKGGRTMASSPQNEKRLEPTRLDRSFL